MSTRTLYHSLAFDDVQAAMAFLEKVGFTRALVVPDEQHPDVVVHAQYNWRDTGGIMFGSRRSMRSDQDGKDFNDSVGQAQCYCVVATDGDVDDVYAKAVDAGATSVQEPTDQDYGGRSCTVRDAEGNQWSFGSYPGE